MMKQGTLGDKIARFLFQYRLTPQTTTGVSPGEIMMGRRLRTRLVAILPKLEDQVTKRQEKQRLKHDLGTQAREFTEGERVYVRFFLLGGKWRWETGKIYTCKRMGPVSYVIEVMDKGGLCRRHVEQIRKCRSRCKQLQKKEKQNSGS